MRRKARPADDSNCKKREDEPANQSAHLLIELHAAHSLLLKWTSHGRNLGQPRYDSR